MSLSIRINLVSFYNIGRIQNASVLGNGGALIEMLLQSSYLTVKYH